MNTLITKLLIAMALAAALYGCATPAPSNTASDWLDQQFELNKDN